MTTTCVAMDVLRNSLPSGLTVWKIPNEMDVYRQRVNYDVTAPTFECKKQTSTDAKIGVNDKNTKRKERIPNLLQQLASHVEDMYESFPFNMKRGTDAYLKQRLLEFVMSDAGNSVLGPKRCREVVAYLGTPMLQRCEPFFVLCSFLLDSKIIVNHQVFTWNHQAYASEAVFQCKTE